MIKFEPGNKLPDHLNFFYAEIIKAKEGCILVKSKNTQDLSYRLYDTNTQIEFLIDCDDIQNSEDDLEKYGGILRKEFFALTDIDEIKALAWKVHDNESN